MAVDINSLLKQYASPWDTHFDYVDQAGNVYGRGYDSYQDAIRKLAFSTGLQEYAPQAAIGPSGTPGFDDYRDGAPATPQQWSHEILNPGPTPYDYPGIGDTPSTGGVAAGPRFNSMQELYDNLMTQQDSPLTYESREKYGRELTEGQLQNMYARYASGDLKGAVPDWMYHRAAYNEMPTNAGYSKEQPAGGYLLTGEKALIGSTPVFGADGKITGYKINMNPEHIRGADTSGRVRSSTNGATIFDPSMVQYLTNAGDGYGFLDASNVDKFGYRSAGNSTYNKEKNFFDKYMPGAIISASLAGLGGALSGAEWATGVAEGASGTAGATGGTGMFDWLGDAGSWISDLFGDSGAAAEGLSDSFWSDWMSGGATDSGGLLGNWQNAIPDFTNYSGQMTEIPGLAQSFPQIPWDSSLGTIQTALASNPGILNNIYQQAVNDPMGTAAKAYRALQSTGMLSGGLQAVGGYLAGNAAQDAAKTSAQAQIEAARIAADAAKFKPVGVTTRFGQSNFTKDAQGNVTSAGYNMPADIKAMQDSLLGAAPGMLSQFTGSQAATAPMGVGAQRAMSLGNQYLNTDPMAQAKKYYDDQQAIMATGRARDQAGALTGEFNRGTYGLATGATGMMGAANPRLEAMYNAQRQQDLQAAANATQGGMDYAKFGAGLVGTGGNMLRDMYGTQTAAYSPFATAMTGAQNIEGLGQNALDMSINIGKTASPAQAGSLLGQGMLGAAQTMQQANQYSPWGTALMNAGNALNTMQQPQQQQQQYAFNPFTGVRL